MVGYYNAEGELVSREEGIALFSDERNMERQVARDEIGGFTISTVHLVIDHNFGDGPPLIFETMIFAPAEYEGELDEWQDRYSTRDEAIAGHQRAVDLVREYL